MPWREVKPMDEKRSFIGDYVVGGEAFADLCARYGISRKTGYKWVARYGESGFDALCERSRRPHSCPQAIPYAVCKAVVGLRVRGRMKLGPKKIRSLLLREHPDWDVPSKTTIYNILRREGLIERRKQRKRIAPWPKPFAAVRQPNDLWTADFKGQFLTGDGKWCFPLTVMDDRSRYLLGCRGLDGTRTQGARDEFERLFRDYGLPLRIRTDNGVPFASQGVGGLSRLALWWIRLGILPERIDRGKPQQNGNHERMHRTLKEVAIRPPAGTGVKQQESFDEFRREYNEERPHESLNQDTPASKYRPSHRPMPDKLPEVQYPGHYHVLRVSSSGMAYSFGRLLYVGYLLTAERIGMEEAADGIWNAYYGPVKLGYFDLKEPVKNEYGYMRIKV